MGVSCGDCGIIIPDVGECNEISIIPDQQNESKRVQAFECGHCGALTLFTYLHSGDKVFTYRPIGSKCHEISNIRQDEIR